MPCILVVVFLLFASCTAFAQKSARCADEVEYGFQTNLKGGYRIDFTVRKDVRYLHLWRADRRIAELNSVSCGLPHKNLGYIVGDFRDYFVLAFSFGSGNPHEIKLIRKRDGRHLLAGNRESCWIDGSEKHSILLYSRACVPKRGDKMALLDMKTMGTRYLDFPRSVLSNPQTLNHIEIADVSERELVLNFWSPTDPHSFIKRYKL